MEIKVVKLGIPLAMYDELAEMKAQTGASSVKDVFNISLTVLQWIIKERLQGNQLCSINKETGETKEAQFEKFLNQTEMEDAEKQLWPEIIQNISIDGVGCNQPFKIYFDLAHSLDDLVKDGHYEFVHSSFTPENFPLDAEGKTEDEVYILHFDRTMTSEEAIAEMEKLGLRPATCTHALAFGAEYPEEQKKYTIVFLGSPWVDSDGTSNVPCLDVGAYGRDLDLLCVGDSWYSSCRFAAVRK